MNSFARPSLLSLEGRQKSDSLDRDYLRRFDVRRPSRTNAYRHAVKGKIERQIND